MVVIPLYFVLPSFTYRRSLGWSSLKVPSTQFLASVRFTCLTLFSRLNRTRYCCLWTSHVPLAAAEPHNPSPHYFLSWTKYQSLWNLTCAGKRMIVYFDRVAEFFNMQYFQFLVKTHSVAHISPWRPLQSSSPFQCGYYSVRLSPSCLDAWDYSAICIELSTFVAESNYVFVTSFLKFF